MIFQNPEELITSVLFRAIVTDPKPLHAVFITYNYIGGYGNGPVTTEDPRLKVEVNNGSSVGESLRAMMAAMDAGLPELNRIVSKQGQIRTARTPVNVGEGERLLVVTYAGKNAFDESVQHAERLRHKHPNMKLLVVSCECGIGPKRERFGKLIDRGVVDAVAFTTECGGIKVMTEVLEALNRQWHEHRGIRVPHVSPLPNVYA